MRCKSKQGIVYSVFPFGSSQQMFLAGEPVEFCTCHGDRQEHDDDPQQIRSLLENVRTICEEEGFAGNVTPTGITSRGVVPTKVIYAGHFFLADLGMRELVRQLAHEIFPQILRVLTFVPQAPASGAGVALELWAIGSSMPDGACQKTAADHTVPDRVAGFDVVAFDEMRWFFSGGCQPAHADIGTYSRAYTALSELEARLGGANFRLDQVLRTWIYQGNLVLPERLLSSSEITQRYKELNRARTDFFGKTPFLKDYLPQYDQRTAYPASTGIGADGYDVVLNAVALDTSRKDVIVVPLENPNQTAAFDYGTEYSPQSPKFSRAMAVAADGTCLIFVSGTASITDSENRHLGDPVKQTEQTLDNIATLISQENLNRHGLNVHIGGLEHLESFRIYIKHSSDYEVIRQVCERRLKKIPAIYTIADVCRPELLVEIEGIALAESF